MKNYTSSVILFFFVLIISFFIYKNENIKSQEINFKDKNKIIQIDEESLNYFTCLNMSDNSLKFCRENKKWKCFQPFEFNANRTLVSLLFRIFNNIKFVSSFEIEKSDIRNFGFDHRAEKFIFSRNTFDNSPEEIKVTFGDKASFDGGVYVKTNQSKKIYVVKIKNLDELKKVIFDLWSIPVLKSYVNDVVSIGMSFKDKSISISLKNDEWIISEPVNMPIIKESIPNFFKSLRGLRLISLNTFELPLNEYEKSEIVLKSGDGSIKRFSQFYNLEKKETYISLNKNLIIKVNRCLDINKLSQSSFYRTNSILQTSESNLMRIGLINNNQSATISKSGDWAISFSEDNSSYEVNKNQLTRLTKFLFSTPFNEYLRDNDDVISNRLDKIDLSMSVTVDNITRRLSFYFNKDKQKIFCKLKEFKGFYEINLASFKLIERDFRNYVLPIIIDLDTKSIQQIYRITKDKEFWFKKNGIWYSSNNVKEKYIERYLKIFDKFIAKNKLDPKKYLNFKKSFVFEILYSDANQKKVKEIFIFGRINSMFVVKRKSEFWEIDGNLFNLLSREE